MRARDDATSGDGAGIAAVSALHAASTIDMKRSLGPEQQARVLGTLAPLAPRRGGVVNVVGAQDVRLRAMLEAARRRAGLDNWGAAGGLETFVSDDWFGGGFHDGDDDGLGDDDKRGNGGTSNGARFGTGVHNFGGGGDSHDGRGAMGRERAVGDGSYITANSASVGDVASVRSGLSFEIGMPSGGVARAESGGGGGGEPSIERVSSQTSHDRGSPVALSARETSWTELPPIESGRKGGGQPDGARNAGDGGGDVVPKRRAAPPSPPLQTHAARSWTLPRLPPRHPEARITS